MNTKNNNKGFFRSLYFIYGMFAIGVALRLKHLLENRSLWLDEAWLSLGLMRASLGDILGFVKFSNDLPLPPMGFLLIEKTFTMALGNSEVVLRLFPFICSVFSLVLFYGFLVKYSNKKIIPFVLGVFVLSEPLVYYAAEVKQYASDLLITLIAYNLFSVVDKQKLDLKLLLAILLFGAFALGTSHVSCFVLFPLTAVLIFSSVKGRDWHKCIRLAWLGGLWSILFGFLFLASYKQMSGNLRLISGAQEANYLLGAQPLSLESFQWSLRAFVNMFEHPLGISPSWVWAGFFLVGVFAVFRQDKTKGVLLALPVILVFVAAYFKTYPFGDRFIIFVLPMLLLFLGEGILFLLKSCVRYRPIVAGLLAVLLLAQPLQAAAYNLIHGRGREDTRSAIKHFVDHHKPDDAVYMNNASQYAFFYYAPYFSFNNQLSLIGSIPNWPHPNARMPIYFNYYYCGFDENGFLKGFADAIYFDFIVDKDMLMVENNKRTWLLLSHMGELEQQWTVDYFERNGTLIKSKEFAGAAVYLYDMSQANMKIDRGDIGKN